MQCAWISLLLAWLVAVSSAALDQTLIAFEIEDQFKVVHTDQEHRQGIFVVVGCDRKGSEFSREWTEALRAALASMPDAPEARVVGLAHLRGAPRLLRGVIRRSFPTHPDAWVLLDWQGLFEDAYGFEKDSATILAFLDGELVHVTSGHEVEAAKVEEIRSALERAIASPPNRSLETARTPPCEASSGARLPPA